MREEQGAGGGLISLGFMCRFGPCGGGVEGAVVTDGALTAEEWFLNARYRYGIRCEIAGEHGTMALAGQARPLPNTAPRARS